MVACMHTLIRKSNFLNFSTLRKFEVYLKEVLEFYLEDVRERKNCDVGVKFLTLKRRLHLP